MPFPRPYIPPGMRSRRWGSWVLGVALALAGCDPSSQRPTAPPAKTAPPKKPPEKVQPSQDFVAPPKEVLQDVPRGVIAGRIVDDDEKPVEALSVTVLKGKSARDRVELAKTKTAADGSFEFKGLPDEWYVLDIETRRPADDEIKDLLEALPEERREEAMTTMIRSVEPFGRFWLHGEKGINLGTLRWLRRGCWVKVGVQFDSGKSPFCHPILWRPPSRIYAPPKPVTEGATAFLPVPDAVKGYETMVFEGGENREAIRRLRFDRSWSLGEVELKVISGSAEIRGLVKDHEGAGVPNAWIYRYDDLDPPLPWSRFSPVKTNEKGGYRFEGARPGTFRLFVFKANMPTMSAKAEIVANPNGFEKDVIVDFHLPATPACVVKGEVDIRLDGMKLRDLVRAELKLGGKLPSWQFGIYVLREGESAPIPYVPRATVKVSDQPMTFDCRGLPAGRYRLMVRPVEQVWDGVPVVYSAASDWTKPLPEMWAPGGLFGLSIRAESRPFEIKEGRDPAVVIDTDLTAQDLADTYRAPVAVIQSRLDQMRVQLEKAKP